MGPASDDGVTPAAVRGEALRLSAAEGPVALGLRGMAASARNGPGLIVHHIGSMQGLPEVVEGGAADLFGVALREVIAGAPTAADPGPGDVSAVPATRLERVSRRGRRVKYFPPTSTRLSPGSSLEERDEYEPCGAVWARRARGLAVPAHPSWRGPGVRFRGVDRGGGEGWRVRLEAAARLCSCPARTLRSSCGVGGLAGWACHG